MTQNLQYINVILLIFYQILDEIILPHVAVSHRVTSVEEPGQIESTVTGFFLMHVLLFSEYPLLLVMHKVQEKSVVSKAAA